MPAEAIFAAASVIVTRPHPNGIQVLMGQRGAKAAFMPSKYVFPGGRVDSEDLAAPDLGLLAPECISAMTRNLPIGAPSPHAITACAMRELAEETGLNLTARRTGALRLVFRAITPMGRPRRFDARFFLADLTDMTGDSTDFSAASSELTHLHWISLADARALDLPFITEVVLAEITALTAGQPQNGVPFFDNSGNLPRFGRL